MNRALLLRGFRLGDALRIRVAVVRPIAKQAAVFSEHGGHVEFDLLEGTVMAEFIEDIVYRQE